MAQVVDHLPCKHEVLNLIPSMAKNKNKNLSLSVGLTWLVLSGF
jgi:hypothetical protein